MPTIVFATSKGGAGKTTSAIVLACELARQNAAATMIDADPNKHTAKWAAREGCPAGISVIAEDVSEENILDHITEAETQTPFVIVDLEGTASMMVAYAISRADLVIIACQGAQDDADEAAKTIKLVRRQQQAFGREIPVSVLMTRTSPAIRPRTQRAIVDQFRKAGIDLFASSLVDREAYRAMRSFGGSIHDLPMTEVSGLEKAAANAHEYAAEVVAKLKGQGAKTRAVA